MSDAVSFTVYGTPQPQGSARGFIPKGWKRPVITSANAKLKPWRQEVAAMANAAMTGREAVERKTPVSVEAVFYFSKPPSVAKKRDFPTVKPDSDKLLRALLDSMTGICFTDDAQVTDCVVAKRYGQPERVEVTVRCRGEA